MITFHYFYSFDILILVNLKEPVPQLYLYSSHLFFNYYSHVFCSEKTT